MKAQSALSVKEANLKAMTAFIYTQGSATKQMFEHELGLSLPTITQNLRAMEADGLIVKGEMQQSTGGRKAQIYEFAAHSSVAIGVRIQTTRITAIAIDLNGKSVATRQRTLPYRNNDAYYQRMNGIINDFAQELAKQGSTVLGVAFCMQGIVSADGQLITFGKIMNNTGLKLNELSHGLNYPSLMIHDSDASAMAELWFDHNLKDAVCIYLERRPRGAVIVDGSLYQGPNQCNGLSLIHILDTVLGSACLDGRVTHDLGGFYGALLRARVEAEDDRAAGLQCDQRLEDGGGGRVGDRGHAGDDADRFGDLVDAHDIVFADDADGLLSGQVIGDVFAGEDVLGGLVFDQTTVGLLDGHLGEHQMLVQRCDGSLGDDTVNLLLIELFEIVKSLQALLDQSVDLSLGCGELLFRSRLGRLFLLCVCHLKSSSILWGFAK